MKKKWFVTFILAIGLVALSGCDQMEEILDKINVILDEEIEKSQSEYDDNDVNQEENNDNEGNNSAGNSTGSNAGTSDNDGNEGSNNSGNGMSDGHENEADPMLSYEERLALAGYSKIDPPNGLTLPIPHDWIMVQEIQNDPVFEAVFCTELQLEEAINVVEQSLQNMGASIVSMPIEGDYDNKHTIQYRYVDMNEDWEGDIIYFIDEYGTTCSKVYLQFNP